jgi:hypothetical protein
MPATPEKRLPMSRYALLAALLAGACASAADALDYRMKPLVGANEPALLAAMGRPPDASAQPAPGVKVLQWRWQRSYAVPDRMLGYTYASGTVQPIPHTSEGMVREACLVEWTVEQGIATHYRWQGNDCSIAVAELTKR